MKIYKLIRKNFNLKLKMYLNKKKVGTFECCCAAVL